MAKFLILTLVALGAQVNADDLMIDILADRASGNMYEVVADLDDATLAKPAKAGGAAKAKTVAKQRPNVVRTGYVAPKLTPVAGVQGRNPNKRVFGGTNKLMAGAGKAIQANTQAIPSYWGGKAEDKGIGYGWSLGQKKTNTVKAAPARVAPARRAPVLNTAGAAQKRAPKRVFGGTNTLMAGKGAAIQESPATPSYWGGKKSDKGIGYGWFQKSKAEPEVQTNHFQVPPPAPRLGSAMAARPPMMMGAR